MCARVPISDDNMVLEENRNGKELRLSVRSFLNLYLFVGCWVSGCDIRYIFHMLMTFFLYD